MSQYTMNLHLTPEMRQVSVYHLCYCLQSLLLLLRKNQFFSSPITSQQSVRKPYRPLLVFNSPWVQPVYKKFYQFLKHGRNALGFDFTTLTHLCFSSSALHVHLSIIKQMLLVLGFQKSLAKLSSIFACELGTFKSQCTITVHSLRKGNFLFIKKTFVRQRNFQY